MNQIISAYLGWDVRLVARKFGIIEKSVLKELIQQASSADLERIAKSMDVTSIMPLSAGKEDDESLLRAVITMARKSGFIVRTFKDEGKRRIIIQHDLGAKWSEFYRMQVDQILKRRMHEIALDATDNSLMIYTHS